MNNKVVALITLALFSSYGKLLCTESPPLRIVRSRDLGGPSSEVGSQVVSLNGLGKVVGGSETPIPNPDLANPHPLFGPAEFILHAFQFRNGFLKALGTLPGGHNRGGLN